MKILIVNDDSIYAPGLTTLARAAVQLGEVWVVAPANQCSAMSQRLSIRGTLQVEKVDDFPVPVKAAYKVDGTPADCVKVALRYIMDERPDYVFSGVNDGCNVGFEIAYSGTLGAAFEAVMNGIYAMAFSNAYNAPLTIAEHSLLPIIKELLEEKCSLQEVWNVNFPAGDVNEHKGILRERSVAPLWLHDCAYTEEMRTEKTVSLAVHGTPVSSEQKIPAGSDIEAILHGYISIGKVKCAVL